MDNLARKLEQQDVIHEVGTIVRADGAALVVRTAAGEYPGKRAVSCLVEPEVDDAVLVAALPQGRCYVLAVLEREPGAGVKLGADGDLQIRLPEGKFAVAAQDGVKLVSAQEVSVVSGRLNVNAVDGNVVLQRLTYLGRLLRSEVDKVKVLAGSFDTVLDRLSQRVKRCYRTVEEFDQLRAERIDYQANKNMSLHARNALVTAKQLVKVDGEQIHLG